VLQSLNGNVHVDRDSFFGIADTSRTRGHSMKLHMRLYSMSSFYTIFSGFVLLIYGTLPDKAVSAPSVASFKHRLLVLICHIMFYIDAFIVSFPLYFMGLYKSRFSCL